jgi:hypothetical protein
MAPANGTTAPAAPAQAPEPEPTPSGTVEGSAGPEAGAAARDSKRSRRGSQPAAKGSAAAKNRKKKAKPPTQEELAMVGEIIQIAYNDGKASMPPQELVDVWRARIAAWDKVHGKDA